MCRIVYLRSEGVSDLSDTPSAIFLRLDYTNFEKSVLRMSPDEANSVWKANAALRVAGV